jgi:hypothetical protein
MSNEEIVVPTNHSHQFRWRKQEINAAVHEGGQNKRSPVPALVCGLLAVHKSVHLDGWSITHIPTGLTVCFQSTQAAAKRLAVELLRLPVSWDFETETAMRPEDAETIKAYIREHGGLHGRVGPVSANTEARSSVTCP